VFCLSDRLALEPGVRLRPVSELGVCLAYTPKRPALHRLNAASWLIASLCDGRSLADITAAYGAALGGATGSEAALLQGIRQLIALGIVRQLPQSSGEEGPVLTS
jgi:hypothetical protein